MEKETNDCEIHEKLRVIEEDFPSGYEVVKKILSILDDNDTVDKMMTKK